MCEWCDENNGEPIGCQGCGRMICWDFDYCGMHDVLSRPYVTSSGDVYCYACGKSVEEEDYERVFGDELYEI